jgi:hypothetical protein
MTTRTTRTTKSTKVSSIAAAAYQAEGVGNTLDILETQSIWSYIVSSLKLSVISFWAAIAGLIGFIVYMKELSKASSED